MFAWSVQIIRGLDDQRKLCLHYSLAAMLVSPGGTTCSILGSVNLCEISRQLFEDQENVQI